MLTTASTKRNPSFAQAMVELLPKDPQAILLTAYSAVPLADSVRGYYEEVEVEAPLIDYIHAPRPYKVFSRLIGVKIDRLRLSSRLRQAMGHVTVIDEYSSSGYTLELAKHQLESIGVEQVTTIGGRWYEDAHQGDIDLDSVSSVHAPFMHAIGRKAVSTF